jgi:DNA-binding transcriptional MerR regulator/GNAT superfamily N-acetyltransferase
MAVKKQYLLVDRCKKIGDCLSEVLTLPLGKRIYYLQGGEDMDNMLKIRDVAIRYNVTARTLRYYEDVGLINSLRSDDYAYRLYDEEAIKRLEQILLLRKLDISVKDIARIFSASNLDVLLDVLHQKADHIQDEVVLLNELKAAVLSFIQEIKKVDFQQAQEVKQLYQRATEIEERLAQAQDAAPEKSISRMMELTEQLENLSDVRVFSLPVCRMASSGLDTGPLLVEGGKLERFSRWFNEADKQRRDQFFARDFMWYDPQSRGTVWWYALERDMEEPDGFETVDFEGGLYASAVSRDEDDSDGQRVYRGIKRWVEHSECFELDERPDHYTMYHIIGTPQIKEAMGYSQLEIYVPIRIKTPSRLWQKTPEERGAIRKRINDAGILFFDFLGDSTHMEKLKLPRYTLIRPKDGETGPTTLYDIRLDGLSGQETKALIDEIKAMQIHVWWDICFPQEIKQWIFGIKPMPAPEPNDEESYMAMLLEEEPVYPPMNEHITVNRVKSVQEFAHWAELTNELFHEGTLVHPEHHYHLCEQGDMPCYIAYIDGQAAGVCCMMKNGDLAALYLAATVPEHRHKGIATALCTTAIDDAAREGAKLFTACAWPSIKTLMRKLGYMYY